jgi:hypothetical protein
MPGDGCKYYYLASCCDYYLPEALKRGQVQAGLWLGASADLGHRANRPFGLRCRQCLCTWNRRSARPCCICPCGLRALGRTWHSLFGFGVCLGILSPNKLKRPRDDSNNVLSSSVKRMSILRLRYKGESRGSLRPKLKGGSRKQFSKLTTHIYRK